ALDSNRAEPGKKYMQALREYPELPLRDHFLILQALERYTPNSYDRYLEEVMRSAEGNTARIRALARFLNQFAKREKLRQWIESLPEEFRDDQEVNLQYIETLLFLEDLPALEA